MPSIQEGGACIDDIPGHLLCKIISLVDFDEQKLALIAVSKKWYAASYDILWNQWFQQIVVEHLNQQVLGATFIMSAKIDNIDRFNLYIDVDHTVGLTYASDYDIDDSETEAGLEMAESLVDDIVEETEQTLTKYGVHCDCEISLTLDIDLVVIRPIKSSFY